MLANVTWLFLGILILSEA